MTAFGPNAFFPQAALPDEDAAGAIYAPFFVNTQTFPAATVTVDNAIAAPYFVNGQTFYGHQLSTTSTTKGRRSRGRIIRDFPEQDADIPALELPPSPPAPVVVHSLLDTRRAIDSAREARDLAIRRIEALERQNERRRAAAEVAARRELLAAARMRVEAAETALRQAEDVERAWFKRLRDEDDLILLAA